MISSDYLSFETLVVSTRCERVKEEAIVLILLAKGAEAHYLEIYLFFELLVLLNYQKLAFYKIIFDLRDFNWQLAEWL